MSLSAQTPNPPWTIPFGLDCRDCGGDVKEINRGQVIARTSVRIVVRCTSCNREYVVEVIVHDVTRHRPHSANGRGTVAHA